VTAAELRHLAETAEARWDGRQWFSLTLPRPRRVGDRMRLAGRRGGPYGRVLGPTADGQGAVCIFWSDEVMRWLDRAEADL
jgi:hypothetical protein